MEPVSQKKRLTLAVDRYVGNRLRMQRMMQDMSMEALADAIGLSYQQVQKDEKGTNRIAQSQLVEIASVGPADVLLRRRAREREEREVTRVQPGQQREDGMKSIPECLCRTELDMETLVCTRGRAFPLSSLQERLRCPRCGSRRMVVMYEPPPNRRAIAGRG